MNAERKPWRDVRATETIYDPANGAWIVDDIEPHPQGLLVRLVNAHDHSVAREGVIADLDYVVTVVA